MKQDLTPSPTHKVTWQNHEQCYLKVMTQQLQITMITVHKRAPAHTSDDKVVTDTQANYSKRS